MVSSDATEATTRGGRGLEVVSNPNGAQLRTAHAALCPWSSNASPPTLGALLLPSRQPGGVPSLQQGHALAKQHLRERLSG